MKALTDGALLALHRDDFNAMLGSLTHIRHMWRFEALRKVCTIALSLCVPCTYLKSFCSFRSPPPLDMGHPVPGLQVPLFTSLSPSQKSQLCTALRPLHVKAGTAVVRAGDAGNTFYVVEAGTCTVHSAQGQVSLGCHPCCHGVLCCI